jgi:hypothetical protein
MNRKTTITTHYIPNYYIYNYLRYVILISSLLVSVITFGQEANPGGAGTELPVMEFKQKHIDLGKVKKGDNIPFSYHFKNAGTVDFTIDFVSGCDCTELNWPVKTFKPGETGTIEVIFLSNKKEKSETVEIDVLLKNTHPETKNPIMEFLSYSYTF